MFCFFNSLEEVTNILAQTSFCANGVYLFVSMQTNKGFLEKRRYLQIGDGVARTSKTTACYKLELSMSKLFWGRTTESFHS